MGFWTRLLRLLQLLNLEHWETEGEYVSKSNDEMAGTKNCEMDIYTARMLVYEVYELYMSRMILVVVG